MNRYGLPYMGSKNKIANWVVDVLPKAEHLYDLFCGGCAVTHAAMMRGKYEHYHVNDISNIGGGHFATLSRENCSLIIVG